MPACEEICPREMVSRDDVSPGVIGTEEIICRAVFPTPRDKRTRAIKRGAITAGHLWHGQLSVWRLSARVGLSLEDLINVLEPLVVRPSGERFDELLAADAATLKKFRVIDSEERAISLLDECTTDINGNKHRAHAHIAICERYKVGMQERDERFDAVQEGLKLIFEKRSLWRRPTAHDP